MSYQFIEKHSGQFPVSAICRALSIEKSAYYAYKRRPASARAQENEILRDAIKAAYKASFGTYGSPRITDTLKDEGYACSENRVARIMRESAIVAVTSRKFKVTTDSDHSLPVAPNLLNRQFSADAPNKVWLSDITYIYTQEKWQYLATIMDSYNREIVGWSLGDSLEAELVINAFKKAALKRKIEPGLIFHSDRGSQYASYDFKDLLDKYQIQQSMSRKGDCYDNAMMESFFKTLKTELIYPYPYFKTAKEARVSIFYYIEVFYNRVRKHSALNNMAPIQYQKLNYAA